MLPKYGANGKFIKNNYPNGNALFPLEGPITDENLVDESLKISIGHDFIDSNILDDKSGNTNRGFVFNDYKPNFDNETLEPKKVKSFKIIKNSKNDGAF